MQNSVPTNEMSEFKGVGLTGVGFTRVDCIRKSLYWTVYFTCNVHEYINVQLYISALIKFTVYILLILRGGASLGLGGGA